MIIPTAVRVAWYVCVILTFLTFTSNAKLLRMYVTSSSDLDTHGKNEHPDCGSDYRCPNLAAAMREAHRIVISNATSQFQVEFLLLSGSHVMNYGTYITGVGNHLTIMGKAKETTFLTCRRGRTSRSNVFSFSDFKYFQLSNVTVTGCVALNADESIFSLSKGVYLSIRRCDFLYNSGVAIVARDVIYIDISWTTFQSSARVSNISAGVHVVHTKSVYDIDTKSYNNVINNTLSVISCKFMFLTYIESTQRKKLDKVGRGAGIGVWLNDDSGKIHFNMMVNNSIFQFNKANSGGGMYLKMSKLSRSFNIVIRDSHFSNCTAVPSVMQRRDEGEGGGLAVYLSDQSRGVVEIVKSNFESNSANSGAAVGVFYSEEALYNNVTIIECNFTTNMATIGGTVVLSSILRLISNWPEAVVLRNVIFSGNAVSPNGLGGALLLLEMDVLFEGNASMVRNSGSAVAAFQGSWVIMKGWIIFRENTGRDGAALYLQSKSQLRLFDSANVIFMGNKATRNGGALLINNADVVALLSLSDQHTRNRLCFITPYNSDYSSLNKETAYYPRGSVSFINNSAALAGGAIYADSLEPCSSSDDINTHQPTTVFKSSNFVYLNNMRFNISTGVAHLTATLTNGTHMKESTLPSDLAYWSKTNSEFRVYLGISYLLLVYATDSFGQPVSTTVTISTEQDSSMQIVHHQHELANSKPKKRSFSIGTNPFSGIASIEVYFLGDHQKNSGKIMIKSGINTPSVIRAPSLTVFLDNCLTGFTYDAMYNTCSCDAKAPVSHCDKDGKVQISPGYWIGQIESNDVTHANLPKPVSYWCPLTYCSCPNGSCLFDMRDPNNSQCTKGRKGTLCGHCDTGYSAVYGAIYPDCLPCSDEVTWIIPVLTIVAFTIVALAVLINFNAASKRVRSGVFYFQVVALTLSYIPPRGILNHRWIAYFAWIPNLSIRFNACLLDNMTTLQSTIFQYYIPGCIFVFMALGIVLARRFPQISRIHVLRPFWSMVTLTYISVTYTTTLILNCVDIGDGVLRWFPDATVKCYEGSHLHAAIAAFLIAGLYILPLPFFLALAAPRISKLKPICDIFLHNIKPSYWWAEGWYFLRRLLLVVFHCLFTNPNLRHTLITTSLFIFLAVHAQFQPYTQLWNNRLETALILNLCLISTFQMYVDTPVPAAATIVFFLIPYVAFLGYLIYHIVRKGKMWLKGKQHITVRQTKLSNHIDECDLSNDASMTTELESVALTDMVSNYNPRLSASLERGASLDVMDDQQPYLREPLLKQTLNSKPT